MTRDEAAAALRAVDRFLQFATVMAECYYDRGMSRAVALAEAEIVTGIGWREIAETGRRDLRALAEAAFERVDVPAGRIQAIRRLLPGWH